jgi:hypothetical protein
VKAANNAGIQYTIIIISKYPIHMNDFKSIIDHDRIFEETKYATKLLKVGLVDK